MPSFTSKFDLPYPILTETADVPRDLAAFAAAVELAMGGDIWHIVGDGATGMGTVYGVSAVESVPWSGNFAFTRRGGVVFFRGAAGPTLGPPGSEGMPDVFVLPAGYRPSADTTFIVADGPETDATTAMVVRTTGTVAFYTNTGGAADGVSFPAVIT